MEKDTSKLKKNKNNKNAKEFKVMSHLLAEKMRSDDLCT